MHRFTCASSLSRLVISGLFLTFTCPTLLFAQYGNNPDRRQTNAPEKQQVTPQQRAAMERASQQAMANQRQQPVQQQLPEGFPISAEHQAYLEKLLTHWEQSSQAIEKFKCNFRRFAYDSAIVGWRDDGNRLAAHRIAFGEIRFASPDRANYQTSTVMKFARPPAKSGAQADYERVDEAEAMEKWVCDGKAIYEFDFVEKRLYETPIPEQMQGNIVESPLPFLFGAKKKQILDRYLVRTATPKGVENEYWLVAYPKRIEDARLYSKIEIILAAEDFLPKAMHMYTPQYDPKKGNEESFYFTFENREVNGQLAKFQDFFRGFIKPSKPFGWKKVTNIPKQAANTPSLNSEQTTPRR